MRAGQIKSFMLFTAAYFMSYFYRSANAVIAPDLSQEILLSAAQLGLMTSCFYAAFASVQIPLGAGLDRWGPRWVTPGLMLLGATGSLMFAFGESFGSLAIGRALIGVGMAGVLMGALKNFSQWFPAGSFATVSGLLVGIGSLGSLCATTPMALFNDRFGWRAIFLIGAVVTASIAVTIMVWTRNTPPGITWTGNTSKKEGTLRDVFTDRRFWRIVPLIFFLAGTLLGFQGLWAGPYLYDTQGLSGIQVGNILLTLGIGTTTGFISSGWLCDRLGLARVIVAVCAISILCQYALAAVPPLIAIQVIYFLMGYTGGYNVMLLAQVRHMFPLAITGKAVTSVNLFGIGGAFVLQWLMGLIIGSFGVSAAGQYPSHAYSTVLLFTATGTLLALLWYLPLAKNTNNQ
jgi:nitrate/nitrite transporter NarK